MNLHQHSGNDYQPKNTKGLTSFFFQPKLRVNTPGDTFEREADTVADQVMQFQQRNHFFKPAVPAAGIVQRIPAPDNTLNPGQTTTTQTQNQTLAPPASKRQVPNGPISRQEFDDYVNNYYRVQDVHDGTQQEQENSLTGPSGVKPSITNWTAWSPGANSEDYTFIIKAIEDVAAQFGAIPNIKTIKFYQVYYDTNSSGVAVSNSDVGASFGAGELTIYQAFSSSRAFPNARSNAQGNYPPRLATISGGSSSPGAPQPITSRQQSLKENIVHELGHGVAEAAHDADPQVFDNFNKTVGWVGTNPSVLYDIGQQAVQTAIAGGTTPSAQYKIEPSNWNDPKWMEQPMSNYSVTGGPGEDFAESITAFIYTKDVFKSRSPARFKFISDNMSKWETKMKKMPPPSEPSQKGDFPEPDPNKRYA